MGRYIIILVDHDYTVKLFDMFGSQQQAEMATRQLAAQVGGIQTAMYHNISDNVQVNPVSASSVDVSSVSQG